ncbi:nucleolar and coiled-body phosphoprotein 1 isoform X3 [Ambystoma mexicanum]|uniref:nucleolar and coiled-body phosphoprotein 1 isoform X3 n=1 Tax=Ambystoma mexicanum TaxID=8296 RepID=UPI0037E8E9AB
MMAEQIVVPSDLFPHVLSFLRENRLLTAAREFSKVTGVKDQDPNAVSLLDIYSSWLKSPDARKRKLLNGPFLKKKGEKDSSNLGDISSEDVESPNKKNAATIVGSKKSSVGKFTEKGDPTKNAERICNDSENKRQQRSMHKSAIAKNLQNVKSSSSDSSSSDDEDPKKLRLLSASKTVLKTVCSKSSTVKSGSNKKAAKSSSSSNSSDTSSSETLPPAKKAPSKSSVAAALPTNTTKTPLSKGTSNKSSSSKDSDSSEEEKANAKTKLKHDSSSVLGKKGKVMQILKTPPAKPKQPAPVKTTRTTNYSSSSDSSGSDSSEDERPAKPTVKVSTAKSLAATAKYPSMSMSVATSKKTESSSDSESSSSDSEEENAAPVKEAVKLPPPGLMPNSAEKEKKIKVSTAESLPATAKYPSMSMSVATSKKIESSSDSESSSSDSEDEKAAPVKPAVKLLPLCLMHNSVDKKINAAAPEKSSSESETSSSEKEQHNQVSTLKSVAPSKSLITHSGPSKTGLTKAVALKSAFGGSSSSSDSSSSDSSSKKKPKKAMPARLAKKNPPTKAKSSSSDSSSDSETEQPKQLTVPKSTPKIQGLVSAKSTHKKQSKETSDSAEVMGMKKMTPSLTKTATLKSNRHAMHFERGSEDSTSSSEEENNSTSGKKRKRIDADSGNQSEDKRTPNHKKLAQSTPNTFPKVKAKKSQSAEPFRRVRDEEIEVDSRVANNSFDAKKGSKGDWGEKANNVLRFTKGKSFRHEKTKKKRGSYCGGAISTSVNSIRFDSE